MSLIQRPDVARKLQRQYGLQRLPDAVLAPEVVAVTIVDDLSSGDLSRICYGRSIQVAVAGQNSVVSFSAQNSGTLCRLTDLWVRCNAANTSCQFRRESAGSLAGIVTAHNNKRFSDFSIPGQPSLEVADGSNVGLPAGLIMGVYETTGTGTEHVPFEVTLDPGQDDAFFIVANAVNVTLEVMACWIEQQPRG